MQEEEPEEEETAAFEESVPIIGAFSWINTVTILTDEFESTATYIPQKGKILLSLERRSVWKGLLRTVWFLLKAVPIFAIFYIFFAALKIPVIVFTISVPCAFSVFAYFMVRRVAPWHGAEHKVFEAYYKTGKRNLKLARKFSPFVELCGGRMAVLLLPVIFFDFLILPLFSSGVVKWVAGLAFFAVAFLAARRFSHLSKPAKRVSIWLQKHWSVREPNELQLYVAHCALTNLVDAYVDMEIMKCKVDRLTDAAP